MDLVQANLAPYPDYAPPQGKADLTLAMNVTRTGEFGWVLNGQCQVHLLALPSNSICILGNSWHEPEDNTVPLLFQPSAIATMDPKVYFSYPNNTLVDVIFTVTAGNPAIHPPHPVCLPLHALFKAVVLMPGM